MRAVFIGCVDFSYGLLEQLLELDGINLVGIITRKVSDFNADFRSVEPLAKIGGVPCLNVTDNDQEKMGTWISDIGPDVVFCFGWSYLLGREILAIPREFVMGYHPSLLPKNRGRHPIVWALARGLKETGSTFFIMDAGADSGDIVSQHRVAISDTDNAASLYAKLKDTAVGQLEEIVTGLIGGTLQRKPQNSDEATILRKRGKKDGEIDWTMPAVGIHNLVRALTRPYVGAHCCYKDAEPKVWAAALKGGLDAGAQPGEILNVEGAAITIQCADGAVILIEHEITDLPAVGDVL